MSSNFGNNAKSLNNAALKKQDKYCYKQFKKDRTGDELFGDQ